MKTSRSDSKVEYRQRLDDALLKLIRNWELWDTDLASSIQHITEVVCKAINNERTSIWSLEHNADEPFLTCIDLYDSRNDRHSSGQILDGQKHPFYIDTLRHSRVIDAHNALTDPRTAEFANDYLIPLGIGAMLDATLRKSGHTSGVVCIEHVGGARLWNEEEQRFVEGVSDLVSQLAIHYELRANETKYRTLFESAGDAIFIMEGERFIDCNEKTLDMFECTRAQIIGKPPYRFSPEFQPDGQSSTTKALQKIGLAMNGERQSFEWKHTKYTGEAFDAEVTLTRVLLDGKHMLLAIVRDISVRKNAEEEALRQSKLLEASIEAMPGIFYMYNEDGNAVLYNHVFQDMFHDPEGELYITHSIVEQDRDRVELAFKSILTDGEPVTMEFGAVTRQGKHVDLLATGARLVLGEKPYLVGAAINISDRVEAERQLALSQQELIERNKNLQLINLLSRELHGMTDSDSILDKTTGILAETYGNPVVVVLSFNPVGGHLHVIANEGIAEDEQHAGLFSPFPEHLARRIFSDQTLKVFSGDHWDISQDEDAGIDDIMNDMGIQSLVCIPMFDNDQPLACLLLMYREQHDFKQLELETMEAIGKILSNTLVNARHVNDLSFQASHDVLTGLPNRSYIRDRMQEMMVDAKNNNQKIALCLIDLNRFKEVNDTLGHETGDRVIVRLSGQLDEDLGPYDGFVGRLGGDEFAVLLPGISDSKIVDDAVECIVAALEKKIQIDSIELELGASIGVSIFPDHGSDPHELLRSADVAMYRAKSRGISSMLYDPEFDEHTPKRLALITDLRSAVRDETLSLYFQPKVDLSTNAVVSLEALLRWEHPQYGMIPPDEFIPLAEVSDIIQPLTLMVVKKALSVLQKCHKCDFSCAVAINVSVRNLLDNSFVDKIQRLLEQYGVEPGYLEIEITESALMIDPGHCFDTINRLSSMGLKLYIDDFGTGYSSMAYLKQLPIDALKIDRTFIRDMHSNIHDETIVRSVINLAHNLGLKVVAEGVEDKETMDALRELMCDQVQGYHIARPMPWDELQSTLAQTPYGIFE